ncbi:dopaminechrome tautomerase [Anabrus simplex]|uniref:dopaminechrome tautomerase n=1 Tax=Anabrus simplex TaxID=316456 RepID=UPI0035A3B74C
MVTMKGLSLFPWLLSMTLVSSLHSKSQSRLKELYSWRQIDFVFPSDSTRQAALTSGAYIPENNLPLGLEIWGDRIFVSLPKWKPGIPATLATIPRDPKGDSSPALTPYPNWSWHLQANCDGLTSVFRMATDRCGRLWVLDSGTVDISINMKQKCPTQILVFNLRTDQLLWRYRLPDDQLKDGSLFINIAVDDRGSHCEDTFAYLADAFRYGLVVYSWREDRSWRVESNYFYPEPLHGDYEIHGVPFQWSDGLFGLALSPEDHNGERSLFFHALSSYREFVVPTSFLRNETAAVDANPHAFRVLEEPRGLSRSQSSGSAMDRQGVLFYNLVSRDAVGCWNSRQPYGFRMGLQGIIAHDNSSLIFPNDLKVDQETRQSLWVLSNRLPIYIYSTLDPDEVNYRILTAPTDSIVKGTVCDPNYVYVPSEPRYPCGY